MASDDQHLFERFRRDGDVRALGDLFDRTAPTLLRLALHLSRDAATAEDLLQGTFLRAIEVRDQWDARRPLLPWLCGILHNRARHDRWQRGRTPEPDRLTVAEPVDPARAAEHAEFDGAVDAAIADLPEVYRPVLRLHLAYGHQPAEIAHALERPPGTVRSQLARGLEMLREVLPAGFAGGAALLLASGRGLACVRQSVLVHAAAAVPIAAVGSLLGGIAMAKKVAALAALALVAAGTWFAWPAATPRTVPGHAPGTPAAAASIIPPAALAASPAADGAMDPTLRSEVQLRPAATTGALSIRCLREEDRSPAWDVGIVVTPVSARDGSMLERRVQPGADGRVEVVDLPAGTTHLAADRGGELRCEVTAGSTTEVELVVPTGVHVRGRVVDERALPVAGAKVWLSERKRSIVDGAFVAAADQDGRFVLRSIEPGRFLSAIAAGRRSAVVQPVHADKGAAVDVELVLRGVGTTLSGLVSCPDGTPAVGARVLVGSRQDPFPWSPRMHAAHRPPQQVLTDAGGAFAVHGLAQGSKQAVWVRAEGCCVWHQVVGLEPTGDTAVHVKLQRGGAVAGRVVLADGKPAGGAWVDHRSTRWFPAKGNFDLDHHGPPWAHYAVQTMGDGNYRIDCITPGTVLLRVGMDELETRGEVTVADGETAAWDAVLADIALRGRVVDERGEPLAGVEVQAMPPRGMGNMATANTDADGRFVCRRLVQVPYVLRFYVADSVRARAAASVFGVEPGGEELLVQVHDAMLPSATITGRLLDTDGSPPKVARVYCSAEGLAWEPTAKVDAATGAFRIGPLPAGAWRLQGSVGEGPEARRSGWGEPFLLFAHGVHDIGVLQMPKTGSIAVTAAGADGVPLHGLTVVLEDSSGWREHPWGVGNLDRGSLRIAHAAPGAYRLRLGGVKGLPTVYQPFAVEAGQETTVHVVMPKGIAVELVLSSVSEPVPIREWFVWRRDGELFHRYGNTWEGHGERTWREALLPGSWEVTITSETGRAETNRFVVAPGDPDGRRIAIRMP